MSAKRKKNSTPLTDATIAKVAELRAKDPKKWTFKAIAERFETTEYMVYEACPKNLRGVGGRKYTPREEQAKKAKAKKGAKKATKKASKKKTAPVEAPAAPAEPLASTAVN